MSDAVKQIKAPVHLDYTVTPGVALSRFLAGIMEGRIVGRRCGECHKVYVPAKGSCPTCGVPMRDEVPVSDRGTLTTFCVVNVPFEGQTMKLPYVYGSILLDGADLPLLHLVQGIAAEDVRMGLRVQAEWVPPEERRPTLESIRWFVPTGEPDAPYASYSQAAEGRGVLGAPAARATPPTPAATKKERA
jgi:uncharacterized OB-fold protein